MIEAAKIDYATRLFLHTQQQLQQVYSSPSEDKERKNNKGFMRKDYGEIRDQKVKKTNKRNC
ncbi:19827_t:CDS:2 [Rhizophagus irregularis]|nr:19827_t:CDS:2 [Rhizophagus irregularis]